MLFIKLGFTSYPPFVIIEYALANCSKVVVIPWPYEAVASGHLPQLNFIGLPTSSISKSIFSRIPSFDKKSLNLIGWQNIDIYQNLVVTYMYNIKSNTEIKKDQFKLPKQN